MTALKEYERLESSGLWRSGADAQRREVIVSFGDATLVMSDTAERPLTHWSLSAVHRENPGIRPALFLPAPDAAETLEIEDGEMIDAIEKVRKSIERARPRPGRLRWLFRLGLPAAVVAAALAYGPKLLVQQTAAVIPPVKRAAFGAEILDHLEDRLGQACASPFGLQALDRLNDRLLGTGGTLVILPNGLGLSAALPGGIIVLDQESIENIDDPLIAAGHVLAAQATRELEDPLGPLLRHAGSRATVQLLTTGQLSSEALEGYADALLEGPRGYPDITDLEGVFDRARVAIRPFYAEQGVVLESETTTDPSPVLTDGQWVALQGICLD